MAPIWMGRWSQRVKLGARIGCGCLRSGYWDGMFCGRRSWRGLPSQGLLGALCTWLGSRVGQRTAAAAPIAVMPSQPGPRSAAAVGDHLGQTAALDALASGPHGASGLREHLKYLVLPPFLSSPRISIHFLFVATLARSRRTSRRSSRHCHA